MTFPGPEGVVTLTRSVAEPSSVWHESVDSSLAEVARASLGRAPRRPEVGAGTVIAQRYRLLRPLGRGAHGIVWVAADPVAESDVAVKLLVADSPDHAARVRAEIASLRAARSAGAVPLLDEGLEGDLVFIVMPIIAGAPFPGCRAPAEWKDIASVAVQLLGALTRVHAMGIVHRDLKPANVLVDAGGAVTVLDFGVSLPPLAVAASEPTQLVGTPAYLAPEQIEKGRVDARADLYSVGVMLFQALTNRLPHEGTDARSLLDAKALPPPPLGSIALGVPAAVATTIDAMLARSPVDRPASAEEIARRLLGERGTRVAAISWHAALRPSRRNALTAADLRTIFTRAGTDRLAAGDAAELLFARTDGDRERVGAELDAWIREGVCRRDAYSIGFALDRLALDRLRARARGHGAAPPSGIDALVAEIRETARGGASGLAGAMVLVTLTAQARNGWLRNRMDLERLLGLGVEVALTDATPELIDAMLYEICRIGPLTPRIGRLESLVRAALSVGPWTDRALRLASELPPFEEVELELLRQSIRVLAARRASARHEEDVLDEIGAWAVGQANRVVAGTYDGWLGRLRYRQGRYGEAAALHVSAAASPLWAIAKARAQMNAASAYMEAFQCDAAARWASSSHRLYRRCRQPYGCAEAAWFRRLLDYRRGRPLTAATRHVDAVARTGSRELEGLACLTEAAIAWRSNRIDLARAIALRGRAQWATLGETAGARLLSHALIVASSTPATLPADEIEELSDRAWRCETPGVGIQVVGLIAAHAVQPRDRLRERVLAEQVPREQWESRIDVLSVGEALRRVDELHRLSPAGRDDTARAALTRPEP
jgi:hypothetical protein